MIVCRNRDLVVVCERGDVSSRRCLDALSDVEMIGAKGTDVVQQGGGHVADKDFNERAGAAMDVAECPASAWQFHHLHHPVITKTDPMDDREMSYNADKAHHQYSTAAQGIHRNPYYVPTSGARDFSPHFMYNHLPLTPPESEPMVSPPNQPPSPPPPTVSPKSETARSDAVAIKSEPPTYDQPDDDAPSGKYWPPHTPDGPLQHLEKTLEETVRMAQRRNSGGSSCEEADARRSGDEDIRVPKVNSNGKLKLWKCRQCPFTAKTKVESWEHAKTHIKPEKLLTCTMCPFVTEFKHHLEYHILNHTGKKPYKCDQCDYRCVNKSMLSSHAKCHSDVHQYRCADCNYVSKYCHSLKLHLRKYGHRPSKVLNPDGSENPYPIIDVYGTRRGPKMKPSSQPKTPQPADQPLPYGLPPQLLFPPPHLFPFVNGFPHVPNPVLLQNLQRLVQEKQAEIERAQPPASPPSPAAPPTAMETTDVLDLSKPGPSSGKNRRKGLAFKIKDVPAESSDEEDATTMFSNVEVVHNEEGSSSRSSGEDGARTPGSDVENDTNNNKSGGGGGFVCEPCGITFNDHVLHTIHMGFHGFNDPFTCNVCGQKCGDRVEFYLHVLRPRHQHGDA